MGSIETQPSWEFSHRSLKGHGLNRSTASLPFSLDQGAQKEEVDVAVELGPMGEGEEGPGEIGYIPANQYSGWKLTTPAERNRVGSHSDYCA